MVLGCRTQGAPGAFAYRAITVSGSPFQANSANPRSFVSPADPQLRPVRSHYPAPTTPAGYWHEGGLGSSLFARRYWGNHFCFLLLGVLRCFTSPAHPPGVMNWRRDLPTSLGRGCPIRVPPDLSLLAAPRSVSPLAAPFVGCRCQGIHRAPSLAWSPAVSAGNHPESASASSLCCLASLYSIVKEQAVLFLRRRAPKSRLRST